MNRLFFTLLAIGTALSLSAQTRVYQTFKDTWIINTRSTETTQRGHMDIRIGHRFGDFAGELGGWETLFGLENAQDVMIGLDYGIKDNLTVGLNRTKGAGPLRQLVNTSLKWRFMDQMDDGSRPFSAAFVGLWSISTMKSSENPESLSRFDDFAHRMIYNAQVLVARKFSPGFSLQFSAGYTHRNVVPFNEENGTVNVGLASRIQLSKMFGLIFDLSLPLNGIQNPFEEETLTNAKHYAPFGIGLEMETGGHVFQFNLTNSRGLMETDYIPNTTSNWFDGQYRLGFTISRLFKV
ncbi:MAG: DUF5777 family beta-barrel protein [Bacteroidota bacterium]